jgi:hypothetical protein
MTEQQHGHGGHSGGHELDAPPTRELFNIVWGLGALTLLSLVTCVQLFNDQARDLQAERAKQGSPLLAEYRKDMETRTRSAGEDVIADANGQVVARYSYIPLASARDLVLAKPEKLGAFEAPPGWIHPDDVAAGGQKAAPTPTPVPAEGTDPAAPSEGAAPAGDVPPAGAVPPAEGAPAPGTKDEAMPLNADEGQSESAKPVPGGTPAPVGAKPEPEEAKAEEAKAEGEAAPTP